MLSHKQACWPCAIFLNNKKKLNIENIKDLTQCLLFLTLLHIVWWLWYCTLNHLLISLSPEWQRKWQANANSASFIRIMNRIYTSGRSDKTGVYSMWSSNWPSSSISVLRIDWNKLALSVSGGTGISQIISANQLCEKIKNVAGLPPSTTQISPWADHHLFSPIMAYYYNLGR